MMSIPALKVPKRGPKVVRKVVTDWPHCIDHPTERLVRRHPGSLLWWCSGGHHFVTQSNAVFKKVWAYEVEEYPKE